MDSTKRVVTSKAATLLLILQAPNGHHQHPVTGTLIRIVAYPRQHHQERGTLHPGGVYLVGKSDQTLCPFVDKVRSPNFDLNQPIAAVAQMHHGIAYDVAVGRFLMWQLACF